MIGVVADASDHDVIREFFELFKTPWEFYSSGRSYDVLLCSGGREIPDAAAKLVLVYSGQPLPSDTKCELVGPRQPGKLLTYNGREFPVYGDSVAFGTPAPGFLAETESQRTAGYRNGPVARVGYDLFHEVRLLLTTGQPAANAAFPTLELHIALLRDLMVASGATVVEIPPVPAGHRFFACLTHDVDHPSIRHHRFDHTMIGFLYRAAVGAGLNFLRGRISARDLLANWIAVLKLPFVHMGLAKDCWREFDDRYLELEGGLPSTFYFIPFRHRPGRKANGPAPAKRAASYGAREFAGTIDKLMAAGCEVGLHGLDAWLDSESGREELEEIRRLTKKPETGVRMHWLYFDQQQSPLTLEKAGAAYDSTVGYNETIGYRAGTVQVFKPFLASSLLELPLHAMDTSMFYPAHLGLSAKQAETRLQVLVKNAAELGGCFTVNWHDRSVAPERLWHRSYSSLVRELKAQGGWFATAGQAVSWFRMRRSVRFEADPMAPGGVRAVAGEDRQGLPGVLLRVHTAHGSWTDHADVVFGASRDAGIPCGATK